MTWCKICKKHHKPVEVNKQSTTIHSFKPPRRGVDFRNRVQVILPRNSKGEIIEGEKKIVKVAEMLVKKRNAEGI